MSPAVTTSSLYTDPDISRGKKKKIALKGGGDLALAAVDEEGVGLRIMGRMRERINRCVALGGGWASLL